MANASMVLLDETLNYLNGKEIDNIAIMGAMIEQEATQFLSFTESTDIVLNEKFSAKELKDKAIAAIKKVIEKIKDFIKWVKDKVVGFFKAVRNKLKSGKSLKQLLSEVKSKVAHESVSFVNEDAASNKAKLDEFLGKHIRINANWGPTTLKVVPNRIDALYEGRLEGTADFIDFDNLKELIDGELNRNPDIIFVSLDDSRAVSVREFISKDWESQLDDLCESIENNKTTLNTAENEVKSLENKLAEINGLSDEQVLNAGSLKDLLSSSSGQDKEKKDIQDQIKHISKYIQLMGEYLRLANDYVSTCASAIAGNKAFLQKLQAEAARNSLS